MASKRLYPRSTIKKIVKAHSNRSLSKNADVLIFLDYTLFVQDLIQEASMHIKNGNRRRITADSIREVSEKSLMKFKC
ncbi:hypothetical protein HO173_010485 [Letharia columbiana]|uniref:Transcription factor CBF/NF-Y/archaeal histone domain-containing protein n=1 Tax=Letharia columbiana TaxID=112416 RepID=A0A8H6FMT7_9LECA|nr:uncharacterized protein HO173_010485 [Letharia columbiana]KAF6231342.1 hypothetical protein HO173_010485 [Letharia columbiana]